MFVQPKSVTNQYLGQFGLWPVVEFSEEREIRPNQTKSSRIQHRLNSTQLHSTIRTNPSTPTPFIPLSSWIVVLVWIVPSSSAVRSLRRLPSVDSFIRSYKTANNPNKRQTPHPTTNPIQPINLTNQQQQHQHQPRRKKTAAVRHAKLSSLGHAAVKWVERHFWILTQFRSNDSCVSFRTHRHSFYWHRSCSVASPSFSSFSWPYGRHTMSKSCFKRSFQTSTLLVRDSTRQSRLQLRASQIGRGADELILTILSFLLSSFSRADEYNGW